MVIRLQNGRGDKRKTPASNNHRLALSTLFVEQKIKTMSHEQGSLLQNNTACLIFLLKCIYRLLLNIQSDYNYINLVLTVINVAAYEQHANLSSTHTS